MILHRMRLTNFRGVADREITFPDRGVVVVCGPNEIGKSSMLEALDLLLEHKDRSGKAKVLQVKPTHADAGSEVEAEISTGPYRFVYRKRFHKRPQTELKLIAPTRLQLTGDEAHERVRAILAETVDTQLWQAQRVLQSAATEAVTLSDCDALARALDAAAGEVDSAGGGETLLIDRIETEFTRYFTGTGRPTKEWRAAIERLEAAEAAAQERREAVADVDEKVRHHEQLTAARADLAGELGPALQRLAVAEAADTEVAALAKQVEQARLVAEAAKGARSLAAQSKERRDALAGALGSRTATLRALREQLAEAAAAAELAATAAEAAAAESDSAAAEVVVAENRLTQARAAVRAGAAGQEAQRLSERLALVATAEGDLRQADDDLAGITVTAEALSGLERDHAQVEQLAARLRADAATVHFTASTELSITIDGTPRTLAAGETWTPTSSAPTIVEVPGVLTVRVDPGATAADLYAELTAARRRCGEALAAAGFADLAAAREADRRRIALEHSRLQLEAGLAGLCAGDDVDRLRARLQELTTEAQTHAAVDSVAAAAEQGSAVQALERVRDAAQSAASAAALAAVAQTEKATTATVLRERVAAAEAELQTVADQLAALRADATDDEVITAAAAAEQAWRTADQVLTELTARYHSANPGDVAAEVAAARAAARELRDDLDAAERALATVTAHLEVMGSEGRQGRLDEAEAELRRAVGDHTRIGERAAAVKLLRDTMTRHRDNTRQRYVQPYRLELERLGRIVFGDTFEVEVDSALTIQARTLEGCTVPYESLSGGAKEQLGILARLAGAALVADEDTVPVVIDDALGFSDPERLDRMGEVFSTVGDSGQVIVLTCQRERYADIADAEVIELSA